MSKTKIIDDEKSASKNYQEHSAKLKKFLSEYMELSGTPLAFYLTAIEKSVKEKGILGLDVAACFRNESGSLSSVRTGSN